jgi:type II secretory pathway pseudopilin PulG
MALKAAASKSNRRHNDAERRIMRRHLTSCPKRSRQHGYALLLMLVLVTMGILFTVVSQVSLVGMKWGREQGASESLTQAKDALIGYALRYRENKPEKMYGYLPLPDMGSSRNNNIDPNCRDADNNALEGCDASTFTGINFDVNGIGPTVVGRFPWRTLGTGPLRDGHGECLWLIVSSLHSRIQGSAPTLPPMNGDTLGQLDILVADGSNALISMLTSEHSRPIAVIFSPGPPLPEQDRSPTSADDVSQCGGNYDAKNYLDPETIAALGGITNYLSGTNNATGNIGDSDPSNDPDTPKALTIHGQVFSKGNAFVPNACEGSSCILVTNDRGLSITSEELFGAIRKSSNFRTDINAMLDRMSWCFRDKIAAGVSFTPAPISGFTSPADKSAGRIADDVCYNDDVTPLGYYSHYKEMLFVAKPNSGTLTVNGDSSCAGVLLFANQRGTTQLRISTAQKNTPSNYLEEDNFSSFTDTGTTFTGDSLLNRVPAQTVGKDIVRCIPASAGITTTASAPTPAGFASLANYDAATSTLTLGSEDVTTGTGATASELFGCAWQSDKHSLGNGLRAYFTFQFKKVGTTVGTNGFVFALADAETNTLSSCGAAGSHLGYSGDNLITPKISAPKIGIEFDQGLNSGFSEHSDPTLSGRNDPCGTSSCGGSVGYNSHVAIVYWGHKAASTTDAVTQPDYDDNVHGLPTAGGLLGASSPPPDNPAYPSSGISFKNLRGQSSMGGDSYLFHVRVEITPTRSINATNAELSNTNFKIEAWIEGDASAVNQISALKNTTRPMSQLYSGYTSALLDTATIYDIAGTSCNPDDSCPTGQTCGSDHICYRPALETLQLGFTGSQRTSDQEVAIGNYFAAWIQ